MPTPENPILSHQPFLAPLPAQFGPIPFQVHLASGIVFAAPIVDDDEEDDEDELEEDEDDPNQEEDEEDVNDYEDDDDDDDEDDDDIEIEDDEDGEEEEPEDIEDEEEEEYDDDAEDDDGSPNKLLVNSGCPKALVHAQAHAVVSEIGRYFSPGLDAAESIGLWRLLKNPAFDRPAL